MPKYRKKPVVIEARQWDGTNENAAEITKWMGNTEVLLCEDFLEDGRFFEIKTLEGSMKASENDFIIKGVKGEFYPCKPDIFEETYELVE